MPRQPVLERRVNEGSGWMAAVLPNCACVCVRARMSASLGAPVMTHVVTRGMLGAGKGWLEEGGAVNSLSSLFPLHLDLSSF